MRDTKRCEPLSLSYCFRPEHPQSFCTPTRQPFDLGEQVLGPTNKRSSPSVHPRANSFKPSIWPNLDATSVLLDAGSSLGSTWHHPFLLSLALLAIRMRQRLTSLSTRATSSQLSIYARRDFSPRSFNGLAGLDCGFMSFTGQLFTFWSLPSLLDLRTPCFLVHFHAINALESFKPTGLVAFVLQWTLVHPRSGYDSFFTIHSTPSPVHLPAAKLLQFILWALFLCSSMCDKSRMSNLPLLVAFSGIYPSLVHPPPMASSSLNSTNSIVIFIQTWTQLILGLYGIVHSLPVPSYGWLRLQVLHLLRCPQEAFRQQLVRLVARDGVHGLPSSPDRVCAWLPVGG
ncbi:hypothetical protein BDN72DRAFT_894885 [Pluteus cervinus]|uniref:Uncharacterized protein n=1 Tax=Pluteus cervinus TaxID=181527 RepID=A0ACD3B334_9AGAR|nr:hypothetical protein BDN72DRAFT_894885 [Pluteus cervinus]